MSRVHTAIDALQLAKIQPVINGTGIVIHTNFGRAPLSPAQIESLTAIATNYTNLEYDLRSGERGHRATYLEHNLALLCEAEATTVVNNCAAARRAHSDWRRFSHPGNSRSQWRETARNRHHQQNVG
jgi:L-seryl-tRNA(Ser) seleniumtransferase